MIPVPERFEHFRRFPMDGALLLFDRDEGINALCEGPETAHLRQRSPRVVQFGITNRCNLACSFCSRDLAAESLWTSQSAFEFLADLDRHGVLEVAFGGGEPWAFPGFAALVRRLHAETQLAVNFTTNGIALTAQRLEQIRGCYGQIRLSLYDDNAWRERVTWLAQQGARFGVNYLVTPERLDTLADTVIELVSRGCSDVLLLSYNGADRSLHLSSAQDGVLRDKVRMLADRLGPDCTLKLDVCWGERLGSIPRLFGRADCGAGRDFISVTSDRRLMACSFHHASIAIANAADAMQVWRSRANALRDASTIAGCARASAGNLTRPKRLQVLK